MKKIYLFSVVVFVACFSFFILIFISYLPFSPLSVSNSAKNHFQTFFPQGWAFFTRNPKEPTINVYVIENKSFKNINCKSGDIKTFFGAQKTGRMQMVEVGEVLNQLPDSLWIKHRGELAQNTTSVLDSLKPLPIKNTSGFKSLEGLIVIEKIDPTPWAWLNSTNPVKMPGQFIYLDVK